MNQKIAQRFNQLEDELYTIKSTKRMVNNGYGPCETIDKEMFTGWKVKVRNLLSMTCGEDSQHFKAFEQGEKGASMESSYSILTRLGAIFSATKDDFEGGYLTSIKNLIQAEVFDSELEQAKELLNSKYISAAAVIAGVVLETSLRELCDRHGAEHGKLDYMNSQLAKAGVYNKLWQKRITALADIRNSAAHGKPEEFTENDVRDMIRDVESFLMSYLA
jgi:hypothetical protein